MARNLKTLSQTYKKAKPMTPEQQAKADELFLEYCSRPQHRDRLDQLRMAWLKAAAGSVARHGNPPNPQRRLAYIRWKKVRARQAAIAIYGDPIPDNGRPRKRDLRCSRGTREI